MPAPSRRRHALIAGLLLSIHLGAHADLDQPLDQDTARALLNRFGYGANRASLDATTGQSLRQYLERALHAPSRQPETIRQQIAGFASATPVETLWADFGPGGAVRQDARTTRMADGVARNESEIRGRQILEQAATARLLESANSDNPGHEVLLNFWLNHFSIHGLKTLNKFLMADYTRHLQQALHEDTFLALLRASFFHPAMQLYLDNAQSTAPESPFAQRASARGKTLGLNENLARELLELHTLGIDSGYTQADIQALARIISGAGIVNPQLPPAGRGAQGSVQRGLFFFNPLRHDFSAKTLLGKPYPAGRGIEEIEAALVQLAGHPATARHIAGKLARRFLADAPPPALVERMAAGFLRSGGKISATLLPLLDSREFADSLRQPSKFKEPVDYLLSVARAACFDQPVGNGPLLWRTAKDLGQAPFMRTTPDGYGSQESDWLSPPAMAKRIRLAQLVGSGQAPLAAPRDAEAPQRCRSDLAALRQAVGPLPETARQALAGLNPAEEGAALLASPAFMRR